MASPTAFALVATTFAAGPARNQAIAIFAAMTGVGSILSGTMLPLDDAPGWMKVLVNINPLGYVVDAERALFAGDFASSSVLAGIFAAVSVAVVGLGIGVRAVK